MALFQKLYDIIRWRCAFTCAARLRSRNRHRAVLLICVSKILLDISQRKPSKPQRRLSFAAGATLSFRSKIFAASERLKRKADARTRKYLCRRGFWHSLIKKTEQAARLFPAQTTLRFLTTHQHLGNHASIFQRTAGERRARTKPHRRLKKLLRPSPCVFLELRKGIPSAIRNKDWFCAHQQMRPAVYCPQGTKMPSIILLHTAAREDRIVKSIAVRGRNG